MNATTRRPEQNTYDRDTALLMVHLEGYINEHFGEPCHDTTGNEDCPTCCMWRVWQDLRELTDYGGDGE